MHPLSYIPSCVLANMNADTHDCNTKVFGTFCMFSSRCQPSHGQHCLHRPSTPYYSYKVLQCGAFWQSSLSSPADWSGSSQDCPPVI